MQNPMAPFYDKKAEYIELFNTRQFGINMDGWELGDFGVDSLVLTGENSLVIPPYGFFVLAVESDSGVGGIQADYADYFYESGLWDLGNGTDEVILHLQGVLVDEVAYDGGPSFPDPKGASMNLDPDKFDHMQNDLGSSWCVSTMPLPIEEHGDNKGTPGLPNEQCP